MSDAALGISYTKYQVTIIHCRLKQPTLSLNENGAPLTGPVLVANNLFARCLILQLLTSWFGGERNAPC